MRSTSSGSRVAASTRTLRSVIQCDGVVTTLMADFGERRCPPQDGGVEMVDVVLCCVVLCCVVLCRRRCYQKAKGRDVYPRVHVNGLGCVCCVRAVRKCVGLGLCCVVLCCVVLCCVICCSALCCVVFCCLC